MNYDSNNYSRLKVDKEMLNNYLHVNIDSLGQFKKVTQIVNYFETHKSLLV